MATLFVLTVPTAAHEQQLVDERANEYKETKELIVKIQKKSSRQETENFKETVLPIESSVEESNIKGCLDNKGRNSTDLVEAGSGNGGKVEFISQRGINSIAVFILKKRFSC